MGHCKGCKAKSRINLRTGEVVLSLPAGKCSDCGSRCWPGNDRCQGCARRARSTATWHPTTLTCAYEPCSTQFTHDKPWIKRKYCSAKCARDQAKAIRAERQKNGSRSGSYKYRARRLNFAPSKLAIAYIYNYTCWICGQLIDLSLDYNHKSALTLDHVIPLARGGTDDLDNLRPAHRACNSKRGAGR
jgi:5-methylcytosine-specific restriction endonuclease McrA